VIRAFYLRLLGAGKPKKVVLVACIREREAIDLATPQGDGVRYADVLGLRGGGPIVVSQRRRGDLRVGLTAMGFRFFRRFKLAPGLRRLDERRAAARARDDRQAQQDRDGRCRRHVLHDPAVVAIQAEDSVRHLQVSDLRVTH
jgi:hypothetical protein